MTDVLVLFGILFVGMSLSVPLGLSLGLAAVVTFAFFSNTPLTIIAQSCITGLDSFTMLAVPFFIMAGVIMSKGGIAGRLVNTFNALVGHKRGGLGLVTVVTCGFFGSISGSAMATVSAVGGFMIPEMKKKGYPAGYAASVTACAGTSSLLIPPSLCLVIYGVTVGASVGDLLIAGIVPGILMVVALCIAALVYARKYDLRSQTKQSLRVAGKYAWDAKWAFLAPIILLGGIYSGIFTPTEASAISVVYCIFVGAVIYRELTLRSFYEALKETMLINGMVLYMVGIATAFSKYLSLAQIPQELVEWITGVTDNPILLMLIVNIVVLIIGTAIDNMPILIIMSPLLLPIAEAAGLDPISFGIVMVLNTTIAIITPPYGGNLFVACGLAGCTMGDLMRYFWVFFWGLIVVLAIVTYFPQVSLCLL